MDVILSRRSIRKYTTEKVPEKLAHEVLKAAMSAPSAGNQQPWHFVVIDKRRILNKIPKFHKYAQMLKEAPLAILVCGDLELEKHKDFWVQDCSAATQNILLAAHARGLGAVWLGIYPREDRVEGARKLLGIPDNVIPFALIPLGYPAESLPTARRFKAQRVHHNEW